VVIRDGFEAEKAPGTDRKGMESSSDKGNSNAIRIQRTKTIDFIPIFLLLLSWGFFVLIIKREDFQSLVFPA
jgi:hypothetical protein